MMDNDFYVEMCTQILSNQEWYCKIPATRIERFHKEFYSLVAYTERILNKAECDFIRTQHPRTPTFYSLPKLHKSMTRPSRRPIISGNGSQTETLSKFVHGYLRPHVLKLPSHIRDTLPLLQNIDGLCIPPASILVAVEALYSSIPHDKGLFCIQHIISHNSQYDKKTNEFLVAALEFILSHNYSTFNGSHYLQV